jgi:hypothetical protein
MAAIAGALLLFFRRKGWLGKRSWFPQGPAARRETADGIKN